MSEIGLMKCGVNCPVDEVLPPQRRENLQNTWAPIIPTLETPGNWQNSSPSSNSLQTLFFCPLSFSPFRFPYSK